MAVNKAHKRNSRDDNLKVDIPTSVINQSMTS